MRKRNPYSDEALIHETLALIKNHMSPYPFKYVSGYVSTLGGKHRPTIMLTVSLQSKDQWKNGILENSAYAHISIDHNGVMEMFSGCIVPKLRKSQIKSTEEVLTKLHKWGEKALSIESL